MVLVKFHQKLKSLYSIYMRQHLNWTGSILDSQNYAIHAIVHGANNDLHNMRKKTINFCLQCVQNFSY